MTKPWDVQGLLELVRGGVRQYHLIAERHLHLERLAEANQTSGAPPSHAPGVQGSPAIEDTEVATLQTSLDHLQPALAHLHKIHEVIHLCMKCGMIKTNEASWEDVVE